MNHHEASFFNKVRREYLKKEQSNTESFNESSHEASDSIALSILHKLHADTLKHLCASQHIQLLPDRVTNTCKLAQKPIAYILTLL